MFEGLLFFLFSREPNIIFRRGDLYLLFAGVVLVGARMGDGKTRDNTVLARQLYDGKVKESRGVGVHEEPTRRRKMRRRLVCASVISV